MKPRRTPFLAVLAPAVVLALAASAEPLGAQASAAVAADAGLYSRYVWRGLTRRNGWVLQPDLLVGVMTPGGSLSVGAWASLELAEAEPGSDDLGLGRRVGESDVWAQYERRLEWLGGSLTAAAGYVRYFVDRAAAAAAGSAAFNTGELYLDGRWRVHGLEPGATIWYDPEEVRGAYAELSGAYRVSVFPLAVPSLYLKMLYGFSWGQASDRDDPAEPAYFADDGLTHIDFSAEAQIYAPVPLGPLRHLYLTPSLHFQVNADDATRRTDRSPDGDRGNLWWGGVAVSWAGRP